MKIARFIGKAINGYLDFNVEFYDDLTFVTGINGSGKTSVLNAIAALLLPRLDYLAEQPFDEITIEFAHENRPVALTARRVAPTTELTCTEHPKEIFSFFGLESEDSIPPSRAREYEEEYYRDLYARNSSNPILGFIQSLPTPMYLGLDRRSLSVGRERLPFRPRQPDRARRGRTVFGRSLEIGLDEAILFAREHIEGERRQRLALDERFRERLVLALMEFPPVQLGARVLEPPTKAELSKFEETKQNLARLPDLLNIDQRQVSRKIGPAIDFLDKTLAKIRKQKIAEDEARFALYQWTFNKANIDKLSKVSEMVSEYNREVDEIRSHSLDYLQTVNQFMRDSGKQIVFDELGRLRFRLAHDEDETGRQIYTLSSGEIQLLVILTHLYFNPSVRTANVFIIDNQSYHYTFNGRRSSLVASWRRRPRRSSFSPLIRRASFSGEQRTVLRYRRNENDSSVSCGREQGAGVSNVSRQRHSDIR